MNKYTRFILRHPLSILYFMFCAIVSLVYLNPVPVIIAAVICPVIIIEFECIYAFLKLRGEFWDTVFRSIRKDRK